jgi:putative intracellular protease/amidase
MQIAILLYPRFTALDCVGPYDVLSRLPGAEVVFCAEQRGEVRTDTGSLGIVADASIAEVASPGIVLVPGGLGNRQLLTDNALLEWIRSVHETTSWTTSVCTGSLLLGAAGLLHGLDATTHWAAVDILESTGARYTPQRIVEHADQRIMMGAGVSAGIDMALHLTARIAGDTYAQAVQLSIEYDPQPPFDTGSPAKAGPDLVALTSAAMKRSDVA